MTNKLYIFISTTILAFIRIFFENRIVLCSDHTAYASIFLSLKLFEDRPIFALDSINALLYSIFPNIEIKEISIFFTFFSALVYLIAIFLVIKKLNKVQVLLLIISPLIFTIVFWHYWTCVYRQGLSTSFLALFLTALLTIKERNIFVNLILLSISTFGSLISHWSAIIYLPIILLTNSKIIAFIKKTFIQIISFRINKNVLTILSILTISLVIISSYISTNSLGLILKKSSFYSDLSTVLGNAIYGTKYPISVFISFSPYFIARSLSYKNRKSGNENFFIDFITFIVSIMFSAFSVGSYMRFLVPLQLFSVINLIVNLRNFSRLVYLSALITLSISSIFGIIYMFFRISYITNI